MGRDQLEREVVILMTDMVQYAHVSSAMSPEEIRDFLISYHTRINSILSQDVNRPLEIEPSAGDGCLVVFDKRSGEDVSGACSRALAAAVKMAEAIEDGSLPKTRMGILLGRITEAQLGTRIAKFGSSFAVANRLEELCGHFGTCLLLDREVARYQRGYDKYLVNIAKVSLASVLHPINIFSLYKPGIHNCPAEMDETLLARFITMKNQAMELFCGNLQLNIEPNFPMVREKLLEAQLFFREITGKEDAGIERILEYIRETPCPAVDFQRRGMELMEKKRDSLGERLHHLSKQLLRAMDADFYHVLVEDTDWECYFKLEWCKKGETIIKIGSIPDGIYYLDSGSAETFDKNGTLLSVIEAGTIFGEMAYFGEERRRTATVLAKTDVVLRKISTDDFERFPIIIRIFERIAISRREEIRRRTDKAEQH